VWVLSKSGLQVPVTPLSEIFGRGESAPTQIPPILKTSCTHGINVIVIVTPKVHCPASGLKVYVVVWVLSIAGDHVPVIPSSDVVGRSARGSPAHIAAT